MDSGDCVKSGNLAAPFGVEPVWELLARAGCDAGTIGNRETHLVEKLFKAKIAGAAHPLLCANLRARDGTRPLAPSCVIARAGHRIGLVGVSVPMVTERMAARVASAFLWDPPLAAAAAAVEPMRKEVDVVIVISHIGITQDRLLAEAVPGIHVILGGHSHTILEEPMLVGTTWICQGGSHGRFVGRYEWTDERLTGGLLPLLARD